MHETEARPTFPHLDNLERVLTVFPDYLDRPVTVTEKIHGFNARVGRDPDGKLWVGTRSNAYDLDEADALQGFTEHARRFEDIPVGVTIYGEWAGKGVQKGIDYGDKNFYVFGERRHGEPVLSSLAVLDHLWTRVGNTVHVVNEGVELLERLDVVRRGESFAAPGQPIEGVVIAPLEPVFDRWGHQVIAKFKSPAFAERASAKADRPALDTESVDAIAAEFVVAERLRHVLDHVSEKLHGEKDGTLHEAWEVDPLAVQHTGAVLRAMYNDVVEDARAEVEALSADDVRLLGKAVNKVVIPLLAEARLEAAREAVSA